MFDLKILSFAVTNPSWETHETLILPLNEVIRLIPFGDQLFLIEYEMITGVS